MRIKAIACGHHSAGLTTSGDLLLWGTGTFGEFLVPTKMNNLKTKFTDVQVGGFFGAVLDENGMVWTWGSNTNGELGVGDYKPRSLPFPVTKLRGNVINKFSCGGSFMIGFGRIVPGETFQD